ncbi:MAG: hypothetical protein QM754_18250 [Tepidisphaeraceae bacterium]
MTEDAPIKHFGNYLRTMFERDGGIAFVCRKVRLATENVERWVRVSTLEELRIKPDNKEKLLAALKLPSWEALDLAWKSTPLPRFVPKNSGRKADPRLMSKEQREAWMRTLSPQESLESTLSVATGTLAKLTQYRDSENRPPDERDEINSMIEALAEFIAGVSKLINSKRIREVSTAFETGRRIGQDMAAEPPLPGDAPRRGVAVIEDPNAS